jgi:hypothetical protein
MRSAYRSVKTAKLSLSSTVAGRLYRSTIYYQAPKSVRAEISTLAGAPPTTTQTIITDGKMIWRRVSGMPTSRTAPYNMNVLEGALPVCNLESLCFYDWDRQLSTSPGHNMAHSILTIQPNQEWNGRKWIVLQESAPNEQVPVLCHYWVDPKTFLIWRTTQRQFGHAADALDDRITKIEVNIPLPAPTFHIPAPDSGGGPLIKT